MTEDDALRAAKTAFPGQAGSMRATQSWDYVDGKSVSTVELHCGSFDISFSNLVMLSNLLDTKLINIVHHAGCAGYSEYTPGSPGDCYIQIVKK